MLTYYSFSALVNCITSLVIGIFVLSVKRKNPVGYTFALYAFSMGVWSFCYFFWQISTSDASAYFWLRAVVAFAIYIAIAYTQFTLAFLGMLQQKKRLIRWGAAVFSLFFILNLFTDWLVVDIKHVYGFRWGVPGLSFTLWLTLWCLYVIYPTRLLYQTMTQGKGIVREQSKYIFWGFIITFLGGCTNYLLWYDIMIPPVGNILVPAFVVMTGYAMLKHRFLGYAHGCFADNVCRD